jgi:uncharacterized membrane protein YdfJ with MMPL/SSD domain
MMATIETVEKEKNVMNESDGLLRFEASLIENGIAPNKATDIMNNTFPSAFTLPEDVAYRVAKDLRMIETVEKEGKG